MNEHINLEWRVALYLEYYDWIDDLTPQPKDDNGKIPSCENSAPNDGGSGGKLTARVYGNFNRVCLSEYPLYPLAYPDGE